MIPLVRDIDERSIHGAFIGCRRNSAHATRAMGRRMPDLPQPQLSPATKSGGLVISVRDSSSAAEELQSIGDVLRSARDRVGASLKDVSLLLRIPPHHLIAIENNAFGSL